MYIITCRANWIKFGGNEYRPGDGVILSMDVDKDLPNIGVILKVYFIDDKMLFQVRIFNSEYESHYRAYTLQNSPAADVKYVYRLARSCAYSDIWTQKTFYFTSCIIAFVN